jgi:hypothetical protein
MEDYIPDIQEQLRRAGYPRFSQSQTQEIRIAPALNASPLLKTSTKWLFGDRDNKTAVVIAPDVQRALAVDDPARDATLERLTARYFDTAGDLAPELLAYVVANESAIVLPPPE